MSDERISTGIPGLDAMLHGGLIPGRAYLVKGAPGTGKTTLAMHFAMAGIANGEDVLYVTLEEPIDNLKPDMSRMGFRVNDIRLTIIDATPTSERYVLVNDFFESFASSMEKMTKAILEELQLRPYRRIILDPISMLKITSPEEKDYRRAFLGFVKSMSKRGITVLMTSELHKTDIEEYLVSGVMEMRAFDIQGTLYRGLRILKFRGSSFDHSMRPYEITNRGIVVYKDRIISLP
ncbi:ATPase [Thermococcus sp. P6]|uniref:RAD55 family ATPase n=1 Tax=Thermococcus sp. P6 TaxID=122420 RepID=UPI000B59E5B1|nr:ATPase domain-containing protein [Thermococcus sp. P6]ASJ10736.1 ATPase [Thermococcus sp. P6]